MITDRPTNESELPGATGRQCDARRLRGGALASVLAALALMVSLEALDQTIVGAALPAIISEMQGSDRFIWVVTAYLMAMTAMFPVARMLSRRFEPNWFLVAGAAIFLLGSALCGAAYTMGQLVAFRAIQGLGAGIGFAPALTVLGDIFPLPQRARWQLLFVAIFGLSSVAGPTVGGWLTDHGPLIAGLGTAIAGWRWIFYINLPLGLVALAALVIYVPADISGPHLSSLKGA